MQLLLEVSGSGVCIPEDKLLCMYGVFVALPDTFSTSYFSVKMVSCRLKSSTLAVVLAMVTVMTAMVVLILTNWLNAEDAAAITDINVLGVLISVITFAIAGMGGVGIASKYQC